GASSSARARSGRAGEPPSPTTSGMSRRVTAGESMSRSHARPGIARLTAVELRKMTDTRAGFWLQLAVVALTVAVVVAACRFARPEDQTLRSMLAIAVAPASVLLPIVGILLVTSEWSQRTGMVTFALVARRVRVIAG